MEVLTLQEKLNIRSNVCRTCLTERTCTLLDKGRACTTVEKYYQTFQPTPDCKEVDHTSTEVPYGKCVDPELQRALDVERENDFKKLDASLARIAKEDACDICKSEECHPSEQHEPICEAAKRFGINLH